MPGRLTCDLETLKPASGAVLFQFIAMDFVYYTLWALLWGRTVFWSEHTAPSMDFKPVTVFIRKTWCQSTKHSPEYRLMLNYQITGTQSVLPSAWNLSSFQRNSHILPWGAWWHSLVHSQVPQSVNASDTWNHLKFTFHFVNFGKSSSFQT